MSDYIPNPDTEMHINQMPEDCLRKLFTQLPIQTQFEAGNVCHLWRTIRGALFRTQKSLALKIGKYNEDESYLIVARLNEPCITFLVALFPSLNQLTIFTTNQILIDESPSVAHLLVQYHNQLVTLKLNSEGELKRLKENFFSSFKNAGTVLIDAINCMSKLKQLTLDCFGTPSGAMDYLEPFDLPILRQLDKLDFNCPTMTEGPTPFELWSPHLEARSTPMEISFTGLTVFRANKFPLYESITPKVASMFTRFIKFQVDLHQWQLLSTRFTNLTALSLSDCVAFNLNYTTDVPTLMRALVNLKQLTSLSIESLYVAPPLNDGHLGHLPQLPTIKKWHLKLYDAETVYSHAHLIPWTANLAWYFPALEDLHISLRHYSGCADCGFIYYNNIPIIAPKGPAKDCLRQQLRLIKQQQQQCPKLSQARIGYALMTGITVDESNDPDIVFCTFDDLAD